MKRVCNDCGVEYPDHADFCNACGSEDLSTIVGPEDEPERVSVRADGQALWMAAILWLIGLGYFLTVRRPRDAFDLFLSWAFLSGVTFVLGLSLRSVRSTMFFPVIAVPFLVAFWYVKLLR